MMKQPFTHDVFHRHYRYDPITGHIYSKRRNRLLSGTRERCRSKIYLRYNLVCGKVLGHRAAFLGMGMAVPAIVHHWPNPDGTDNRWTNLNVGDYYINRWERGPLPDDHSTGHRGIYIDGDRFVVDLRSKLHRRVTRRFRTLEAAVACRNAALIEMRGGIRI